MAMPPSFGGELRPQAAPANRPDPAAYGAGLAQGIGAVGDALFGAAQRDAQTKEQIAENDHRIAMIVDQRNLSAKMADRGAALATGQADLKVQLIKMRETAGPDYEEKANALVDKWSTDFMGTLDDPRLVNQLRDNVASVVGNLKVGEAEFAARQRGEKQAQDFRTIDASLSNTIFTSEPAELGHNITTSMALWDKTVAAAPLDDNGKAELLRQGHHNITFAGAKRLGLDNPAALIDMIDKGALNEFALDDKEIPALRNWGVALQEHREVQARQVVTEQRQDAKTFLQSIQDRVSNGIPVDPEDFVKARTLIGNPLLKLEGEGFDAGKAETIDRVNRKWATAPASQIDGRIKQIDAEVARMGDKVDPGLVLERNRLQEILPSRRAEQRTDPLGRYARGGGAVTPIDWTDPASLQNRVNESRIAQNRGGGPLTVLTDEEVDPLHERMQSGGVAGRVDVMNTIAAGGADFATAAARQIAPADMHFRMATALATLGRDGRAAARDSLLGSEAISAHKGIVREKEAQAQFGRYAMAMRGLDPQTQHGLYDTALGIFATRRARAGKVDWPENDAESEGHFRLALSVAVGASKRPDGSVQGGFGTWGGTTMILPHDMTQEEFDTAIARSGPNDFKRAAGGHEPIFDNGKSPTLGQFKQLQAVAVGDGVYRLQLGNSALHNGDGGTYEFDIHKLLPR